VQEFAQKVTYSPNKINFFKIEPIQKAIPQIFTPVTFPQKTAITAV